MIFCVSLIKENSCKAHSSLDSQMKPKLQPPPNILELMHFCGFQEKIPFLYIFFIEV